ncbi:MAG TPA: metal-dependent hydrolase [Caulobacteraceae bacterium]
MSKNTPADVSIKPRDLRFDVSGAADRHWLGGDAVGTAVFNALSLTFPDGERMFMDAVRSYRPQVSGKLLEDVKGFIAQEAIHSREHHGLNHVIDRKHYPADRIEAVAEARTSFARNRGPMIMLVSTICLEHFTAMMADLLMDDPELFAGAPADMERMWRWHAMEETEHKAVAYDVFMEVTKGWPAVGRYLRRSLAMAAITLIFTRNITNFSTWLLEADGYSPRAARKAVRRYLWGKPGIFARGWRTYFAWYRPGFHPWDQDNRAELAAWQAEFQAAA